MSDQISTTDILPVPSKKIIGTLRWGLSVGESEFYTSSDDRADLITAYAWLDTVEEGTMSQDKTTNILRGVEAKIDAILRGNHSGWDQALATLRDELRKELANV